MHCICYHLAVIAQPCSDCSLLVCCVTDIVVAASEHEACLCQLRFQLIPVQQRSELYGVSTVCHNMNFQRSIQLKTTPLLLHRFQDIFENLHGRLPSRTGGS
mmetsp:Transcript_127438/g.179886  ORF Transcript_127438/g.179886 Transcript_127438/m.179886 type:complete len:102 (+) Transcript_127438:143-448(+)